MQVFTQAPIKTRAVEQKFDIARVLLAIPCHLALRGFGSIGQRVLQSRAAQAFEYALRYAFQCRKTPPIADDTNRQAQAPQA
ncbi:hypothetical protein D3C85_1199620 [compost metagenome]